MAQRRTQTVALGGIVVKHLAGAFTRDPATLSSSLIQVIRYYLADTDSGRDAWSYPVFLGVGRDGLKIDLTITIDAEVWDAFSREASRQGASTNQLLQHAALYFLADRDSGHLARRIVKAWTY